MTSSGSGNRLSSYFEKIICPSATTSKMPWLPSMNSGSTWIASAILAARLEALGRYFQRPQYVMAIFIRQAPYEPILPLCLAPHQPRSSTLILDSDASRASAAIDCVSA